MGAQIDGGILEKVVQQTANRTLLPSEVRGDQMCNLVNWAFRRHTEAGLSTVCISNCSQFFGITRITSKTDNHQTWWKQKGSEKYGLWKCHVK